MHLYLRNDSAHILLHSGKAYLLNSLVTESRIRQDPFVKSLPIEHFSTHIAHIVSLPRPLGLGDAPARRSPTPLLRLNVAILTALRLYR